jgi:hypothetical protein
MVMVEGLRARLLHILVRNGDVEPEVTVSRVLERRRVGVVGENPGGELVDHRWGW